MPRRSTRFGNITPDSLGVNSAVANYDAMTRADPVRLEWSAAEAAAADTDAVHAATTSLNSGPTTWTTGLTNPPCARNITATSGGTAGDIAAGSVVVTGTDINDKVITETLPVFTENSGTTVVGDKAFKTVTQVVVPDMDGAAASVAIGFGDKLGLPMHVAASAFSVRTTLDGVAEGTAPTIASDASVLSENTIDLNSALDGSAVVAYLIPV